MTFKINKMRRCCFTAIVLMISFNSNAQVLIDIPYKWGQVHLTIHITYPPEITTVDSVRLEATYEGDFRNPVTVFTPVITVKNKPDLIKPKFNFEHDNGDRSYRCIIYKNDKSTDTSNVFKVKYGPFKFDENELPKVTNLKYYFIEKDGKDYIHLYWDEIPEALGYHVTEKNGDNFNTFQLYWGGPYGLTSNNYLDVPVRSYGQTITYAVCGIQKKQIVEPTIDIVTLINIDMPEKRK